MEFVNVHLTPFQKPRTKNIFYFYFLTVILLGRLLLVVYMKMATCAIRAPLFSILRSFCISCRRLTGSVYLK